mgnify:CR=1 FL=1
MEWLAPNSVEVEENAIYMMVTLAMDLYYFIVSIMTM